MLEQLTIIPGCTYYDEAIPNPRQGERQLLLYLLSSNGGKRSRSLVCHSQIRRVLALTSNLFLHVVICSSQNPPYP